MVDHETTVRTKFLALNPVMDERLTRLWAGAEADALGDGGIAIVERATGLSRTTIRAGRGELRAGVRADDVVAVRRPGGGRPRLEAATPEIVEALERLVDPVTRGDPESPLRWTSKSTRKLAAELTTQGYAVSPQKVGQLLNASGYSLQAPQKTIEGTDHPDRDAQFEFINDRVDAFQGRGAPVISVDTKKKELVGAFGQGGMAAQRRPRARPRARLHGRRARQGDSVRGLRPRAEYGVGQRRRGSRHPGVRGRIHRAVVAVHGEEDVSERTRPPHHGRCRRKQQRSRAALESGAAAVRRSHRLDNQRVAFSTGAVEMEQDRAPAVLPHHGELAWPSIDRSRDRGPAHWECSHNDGVNRQGQARPAPLSPWRESTRRGDGQSAPDSSRVSW